MSFVVFVAALLVLAICVLFTLHKDYHAGFVGTIGLAVIGFGALARAGQVFYLALDGEFAAAAAAAPSEVLLLIGIALFAGRQAWVWWCRRSSSTWYAVPACAKVNRDPEATVPQSARQRVAGNMRGFARMTILPWLVWSAVIGMAIGFVLWAGKVVAEPLYAASIAEAKVIIYSEACAEPAVGNLPKRATWQEMKPGGASFEGCCGRHPHFPIIVCYFAGDRSVVVIHSEFFDRVSGT